MGVLLFPVCSGFLRPLVHSGAVLKVDSANIPSV